MPRVARIRVPIYQETGKHTLYRIEVTTDDGRTRKVERRYRDVLRFHGTLCRAAPHPKLEQFDFPHKSILNTNAEFTKERRRSGFEAYFALLLSLGPNYAPFVETFLKADERTWTTRATLRGRRRRRPWHNRQSSSTTTRTTMIVPSPSSSLRSYWSGRGLDALGAVLLPTGGSGDLCALLRPHVVRSSPHRGPVKGQAWLAVLSAPLVLCVALALLAPAVDDSDATAHVVNPRDRDRLDPVEGREPPRVARVDHIRSISRGSFSTRAPRLRHEPIVLAQARWRRRRCATGTGPASF